MGGVSITFLSVLLMVTYGSSNPFRSQDFGNLGRNNDCKCECGISKRQMRVVGGNETKVHEFPWIAGLNKGGEFLCGSTLITARHVLTAAHCVHGFDMRELNIALADHDRESSDRFSNLVVRGIKSIREHEAFDPSSYNNDIAILELDHPVRYDNNVQPACLPDPGVIDYAGRLAVVAGWGRVGEDKETSSTLRKVVVPVWTREECHQSGYSERKISENMICAGYPDGHKDACQGDSGGPLHMKNVNGNMAVIGIVSWGRGCARPKFPGIYTKVWNYMDWIDETLNGECLCSSTSVNPRRA